MSYNDIDSSDFALEGVNGMKNATIEKAMAPNTRRVITSRNSPELARKIQEVSAKILKKNYHLYKELENK